MKFFSKVPGGFSIGRLEIYVIAVIGKGPKEQFFQRDKTFCGCFMVSVGRLGVTWMSKQCLDGFNANPDNFEDPDA